MAQKDVEEDRVLLSVSHPAESANSQTTDVKPAVLERELSQPIPDDLTCCQRMKLILSPIQKHETIVNGNNAKTVIHISPEAFRMLFYIGFIIFTAIAMVTTILFSEEFDINDNVLKDRYGAVSICIFYDFPPFSHFGATLWLPNVFLIDIYLIFDLFRVHDAFHEGQLGNCFYRCYCVVTMFELFAFSFFLQITATDPIESMYWHSIPYVLFMFAQWTLAFKHVVWFLKTGVILKYSRCTFYTGCIYMILMFITIFGQILYIVPNLFEAETWKINGLGWTPTYMGYSLRVYTFLTMIAPLFIYYFLAKEIETAVVSIAREGSHWDTSK